VKEIEPNEEAKVINEVELIQPVEGAEFIEKLNGLNVYLYPSWSP